MINKNVETKLGDFIAKTINLDNISKFFDLVKLLKVSSYTKQVNKLSYITRCFTMASETQCFLELDYAVAIKIISSSNLQVTSEIEIFDAADCWIRYNIEERKQHAINLLLQVRFPLLSDHAIKYILQKNSSFNDVKECRLVVEDILKNKSNFYRFKSKIYFTNRYCNQKLFSIVISGGSEKSVKTNSRNMYQLDQEYLKCDKSFALICKNRNYARTVFFKSNIYSFGGSDDVDKDPTDTNWSVERYSTISNTSSEIADLDEINRLYGNNKEFCICVLLDKIYLIGGNNNAEGITDKILEFDTKTFRWKKKARMQERREGPACSIFEGRIVVSGGLQYHDIEDNTGEISGDESNDNGNYYDSHDYFIAVKTVEVYDHVADSWSYFPSMIYTRCYHKSVSIKNKLFMIGGGRDTCEVYDSTGKQFVALKSDLTLYKVLLQDPVAALTIGSQILVFGEKSSIVLCYDVFKDEWTEKSCEITKHLVGFSCVKVPQLKY